MALQLQSLIGLIVFPAIAWLISENRRALATSATVRFVVVGVALQLGIAALMLKVPGLQVVFEGPSRALAGLQAATGQGMQLVFGHLAGAPAPYAIARPENSFVLALQALPLILIISVLTKLLYHWGVLQLIVRVLAHALQRAMGVSGPLATSAAANVFLGMVEAPLVVRPYLKAMSRGELFATMAIGMAGVAGTVLALYASLLEAKLPGATGHLIVASIISVPAAILVSSLMVPFVARAGDMPVVTGADPAAPASAMDAITTGTREGVELLVNVTAMLIVAVALVAIANQVLAWATTPFGGPVTLQGLVGLVFAPLAWLTGIPAAEAQTAGSLLGVKTVLNEFVAYLGLAGTPDAALSPRSRLILTYGLCGFANFGSLGILIGGLVAMVPERRGEILELGLKTVVAGTLATLMTAAAIGVMTPA